MKMRWLFVILAVFHLWHLSGGVYNPPDGRRGSCRILPGEQCEVPAWKENAEYLVLHFFAEEAGMLELNLNSGEGAFHENIPYSSGEQFKILPLSEKRDMIRNRFCNTFHELAGELKTYIPDGTIICL